MPIPLSSGNGYPDQSDKLVSRLEFELNKNPNYIPQEKEMSTDDLKKILAKTMTWAISSRGTRLRSVIEYALDERSSPEELARKANISKEQVNYEIKKIQNDHNLSPSQAKHAFIGIVHNVEYMKEISQQKELYTFDRAKQDVDTQVLHDKNYFAAIKRSRCNILVKTGFMKQGTFEFLEGNIKGLDWHNEQKKFNGKSLDLSKINEETTHRYNRGKNGIDFFDKKNNLTNFLPLDDLPVEKPTLGNDSQREKKVRFPDNVEDVREFNNAEPANEVGRPSFAPCPIRNGWGHLSVDELMEKVGKSPRDGFQFRKYNGQVIAKLDNDDALWISNNRVGMPRDILQKDQKIQEKIIMKGLQALCDQRPGQISNVRLYPPNLAKAAMDVMEKYPHLRMNIVDFPRNLQAQVPNQPLPVKGSLKNAGKNVGR